MAIQYVTLPEHDFGAGIDQQSPENKIPPGYVEDIENADPKSTGPIAKRTGYQGFAGYVPVRVQAVDYSGTTINLILDESINIPLNQVSPLILVGKTSEASGDFASFTSIYYPEFSADIRRVIGTGTPTISIPADDHGMPSTNYIVGVAQSTSETNRSNSQIYPDTVTIDTTTTDVDLGFTNSTGAALKGYFYFLDKTASAGSVYVATGQTVNTGSNSFNITQATHGLIDSNNIQVYVYEESGTDLISIIPDNVYLNDSTGEVQIDIENNTGSAFDARFILSLAPTANFMTGAVATGQTETIAIDISGTGDTPFPFISCYLDPSVGSLEQVLPDSITVDDTADTVTVSFTNNTGTGANFEIYWDFATLSTNQLSVTASNSATFTDTEPQLTLYGLCHEEIYESFDSRQGWTTHIDSYRVPGESRLITGLGGNLFSAVDRLEDPLLLMPTLYPRMNARVDADQVLGPAFWDSSETPSRSRGYITGSTIGTNLFEVESISYNSDTGWTDYTLTVPDLVISGTLADIVSATAGQEDRLTVSQAGYSFFNGEFTIKDVASGVDSLVISVDNPGVTGSDYDEQDVGGSAGVFTGVIELASDSPFLPGDSLNSDIFTDTDSYAVVKSNGTAVVIGEVADELSLPGGLRIVGERTSSILPLRDTDGTATVENLVRGDMLSYTGIDRQLRILSINQLSDISVSISGDGATATVTLGSGSTDSLFAGKSVLLSSSLSYVGVYSVVEILSTTQFTIDSPETTTEAGLLVGKTIEVDEQLTFADSTTSINTLQVPTRWSAIESPTDNYGLTPNTRTTYFDSNIYTDQPILRSTMVKDTLYLTNQDDEVMKFDGQNIYRAGLFRWQPNLFATVDSSASATINTSNEPITYDVATHSQFKFTSSPEDGLNFAVGDEIRDAQDTETYIVQSIKEYVDSTGTLISTILNVDKTVSGTSGTKTLAKISNFTYYFRLNAVDANNNILASAATGSEDFVVKLDGDAAINIKLVGMPAWDVYDYDRLEVQIYRTKANEPAPFYRLVTLVMPFGSDDGYLEYNDSDDDDFLTDLDEVNTALKGAELGTAWEEPLRAKYCTAAGNRLILGNLKDYPELDIRFIKTTQNITSTVLTTSGNRLWQFRKDNTSTATGTDMLTRAQYEFTSTAGTVSGITGSAGVDFTVTTSVPHLLEEGHWVYLFHSAVVDGNDVRYCGLYQINSAPSGTTFTINSTLAEGGPASNFPNSWARATVGTNIPVYLGIDGNFAMNNGNFPIAGAYQGIAVRRLAAAINASMRNVDTSLVAYADFEPWMTANAGNEYNFGQLIVRQPKVFNTILEVETPNLTGDFAVFVNSIERDAATGASALTNLYPSRILVSYDNYPEIFDNPTATVDSESDSVIDINSADGQEITALIPFFGESAFGAAQKSGIVVVFKTNSIYLVDLAAKAAGQNAVQRLETRGKGCTAPFSVAVTKGGIMFANDTGIYRLNRNLEVDYIGRKYERKWKDTLNRDQIDIVTGHHDSDANAYKVSYVTGTDTENSNVAVYNHTREYETQGLGSWTTYTNHPVTGWANLDANSFFGSTRGRVFTLRKTGNVQDYRDDNAAIPMTITTRAMDGGDAGRRKVFGKFISHFRVLAESVGTAVFGALDLNTVFQDTDALKINTPQEVDGLGSTGSKKIQTIMSALDSKVGIYLQLQYTNSTLDEPVELAGIDLRVGVKSDEGIQQAAQTTD